jgi:hypothetical protein
MHNSDLLLIRRRQKGRCKEVKLRPFILILVGLSTATVAQRSAKSVKDLMTVSEFNAVGLNKLSNDELDALDRWFVKTSANFTQRTGAKASSQPICGRDMFNINVDVERHVADGHDPEFINSLVNRQDMLAKDLQRQIDRAGLHHELGCPVILSVFGMLLEHESGKWDVGVTVRTDTTGNRTAVYPSWEDKMYKVWWKTSLEAERDLERQLPEHLQRFLTYFGKP